MSRALAAFVLAAWAACSPPIFAQDAEAPPKPKAKAKPGRRGNSRPGEYMGRAIAPVMTFHGADWLMRPEREQEEQPDKMIDALKIKPGDTVADVGAGIGYTSLRLAKRVGPTGSVLATDVQPEMIRMLKENARAAGATNIKPILCTPTESKLPVGTVDLALLVDVYHECVAPEATLADLRKALKPDGRLVLVEFRGEDPNVPIKPEHKMTVAQAKLELEANGFKLVESPGFLPWQHILIFSKTAEPAQPPAPAIP